MIKVLFRLAVVAVTALLSFAGCRDDGFVNYTVASEIVLSGPEIDVSDMSVTVSAIYNGDDSGISDAWFTVWKDGEDASQASRVPASWGGGNASAVLDGLEVGNDYWFNFVILTSGDNLVTAEEDRYCAFSLPHDFSYSTVNTVTSKILQVSYKGADAFISSAKLVMVDADGENVENLPEISFHEGVGKALFVLSEWTLALYKVHVEMTMYDGSTVSAPEWQFSLLPLPEILTVSPVNIEGDVFNFSASYDGDDSTIEKAVFSLYDKDGVLVQEIDAVCADRTATASRSGNEYGRYSVKCTLYLVDGSTLESETLNFTHSRPRAYENMLLEPVPMGEAGMATSSENAMDPNKFSYLGYDWEYQYMYVRSSSSVTLYVSSSYSGFFMNTTPFENGIRTVYINHSSGKDTDKFHCYAKTEADDEWVELDEAVKQDDTFIYDLSGDHYCYFRFETRSKADGGQELKANSFAIDYYTEAPEIY